MLAVKSGVGQFFTIVFQGSVYHRLYHRLCFIFLDLLSVFLLPGAKTVGLFFVACVYRLTRKRVHIFFQPYLIVRHILLQLILYIRCYCLFILTYRIYVISSAPEFPVAIPVFHIRMLIEYHQAAFPFQISHET